MTTPRAAVLVPLLLLSVGCDGGPTGPDDPSPFDVPAVSSVGRIAFVSSRGGGQPAIHLVNPDGRGVVRLVEGDAPAWSPDGRTIAFQSQGDIRQISVDGSGERALVENGADPAFSPDGRSVAFVRDGEIFVVDADGTEERLLVGLESLRAWTRQDGITEPLRMTRPVWSRDGSHLATVMSSNLIVILRSDGSGRRAGTSLVEGHSVDFSPDGNAVLVSRDGGRMVMVPLDGSPERRFPFIGAEPRWSADGTNIVYVDPPYGYCMGGCPSRIFLMDPGNTSRKRLVPDTHDPASQEYHDFGPVWSSGPGR